jgi:polyphosphate kinase 2 (PPK2 family)
MRAYWEPLIEAYEEVFARTSTEAAPWHVVPANRKWVRDLAVARILVDALEELRPDYPRDRVVPDVVIPD